MLSRRAELVTKKGVERREPRESASSQGTLGRTVVVSTWGTYYSQVLQQVLGRSGVEGSDQSPEPELEPQASLASWTLATEARDGLAVREGTSE
jgi:hypothetical protein